MSDSRSNEKLEPPYIECTTCGTQHHYDATIGKFKGHCRNCGGYLRRPTEEEHKQFARFLKLKTGDKQ